MMRRWWMIGLALLVLLAPLARAAAVRAFLDRTHVSLGDTVTLNIQSDGSLSTPDLSPLENDFQVLGTSSSSSVKIVNGKATATTQLGIALKPLHPGDLTIPALSVGNATTQPLTLHVGAGATGGRGQTGDAVFMEASVGSSSPYVGQETTYTVRLFYQPGVNGSLSDPVADGARLIKLDQDHSYMVDRNGYTYRVVEYEWALIPQRTGAITVRGPTFQGQQLAVGNPGALLNNPNALLNGQIPGFGAQVNASAPAAHLDVRSSPAGAGKPWLPAREVQLKLTGVPANGQVDAGVPLTLTLSISATGQPADALPEPELPAIAGARVYPDQTQDSTDDSGQWLQSTRTRSFAIVPQHNGALSLPAITLDWWNVALDHAEQARVPAQTLHVSGVVATPAASAVSAPVAAATQGAPVTSSPPAATAKATPVNTAGVQPYWRVAALASLVLWLMAVVAAVAWWLRRRRAAPHVARAANAAVGTASPDVRDLRQRALDAAGAGHAEVCEHALLAWARVTHPHMANAGALRAALSDPAQRDALDALQRARWQGGGEAVACAAVARAFARGFAWRADEHPPRARSDELPPLYPL